MLDGLSQSARRAKISVSKAQQIELRRHRQPRERSRRQSRLRPFPGNHQLGRHRHDCREDHADGESGPAAIVDACPNPGQEATVTHRPPTTVVPIRAINPLRSTHLTDLDDDVATLRKESGAYAALAALGSLCRRAVSSGSTGAPALYEHA
jgi:hypothetical protein